MPSISQVRVLQECRNLPPPGGPDGSRHGHVPSGHGRDFPITSYHATYFSPAIPVGDPRSHRPSVTQLSTGTDQSSRSCSPANLSPRSPMDYMSHHSRRHHRATACADDGMTPSRRIPLAVEDGATEKKIKHSRKEMNRRNRIKKFYDDLRINVPGCCTLPGSRAHSKEYVLQKTVSYVESKRAADQAAARSSDICPRCLSRV